MHLHEWLKRVGFIGNPFALKQADDEGEQLNEYFVAHPSYNAVTDFTTIYRSSILHAPRGSGKSSMRRMFELHCQRDAADQRALVVRLNDWMPITARMSVATVITPDEHFKELARRVVLTLAQVAAAPWQPQPLGADLHGQLVWLCVTYDEYLTPNERCALAGHGWLPEGFDARPYAVDRLPIARRIALLAELVIALGFHGCYVLIDGVDELLETAADWSAGANLIEALVANLAIVEAPRIAFKFFVPSEVVAELQSRGRLRHDRLQILAVSWDEQLLRELLARRLQVFSNNLIQSLDQLRAPGFVESIDRAVVRAAAGSPRTLLNVGDTLFQICAEHADVEGSFIRPAALHRALRAVGGAPPQERSAHPPAQASTTSPIPLLRIKPTGEIWLGDQLFEDWSRLTPLQRRCMLYLYHNRDRLCSHQEVINHVWAAGKRPSDEDSLRKLVDRLIQLLEADPKHPRYIYKVPGYLRLMHTAE